MLCRFSVLCALSVPFLDYNKDGNHGFIGSLECTLSDLIYGWWCGTLTNYELRNTPGYKNSGGTILNFTETLHMYMRTAHFSLHTTHCTLHTTHYTLHTVYCAHCT